ncbi:APC family permease [Microbacterium sp. W4I20]|uniref:APC family permease n=1 Tax=Microbacterium sp. W4I20 TaxID=3042262 RepID=UPI002787A6C5|nr:APC family permease [Microbacterium sp. W4I20]MDQ0728836.1 amino acid transporter [Microbacterium sp. W4I20]
MVNSNARSPTCSTRRPLDSGGALAPIGIAGLALGVIQGVAAQYGYGGAVYFAEETRNPRRNVARAVLLSALITVVIEVVPLVFVMLGADSLEGLIGSEPPVQAFLEQLAGHALWVFVLLSIALAILNANIALSLQAGRLLFVAARDRAFPAGISRVLSRVSGSAHMPRVATVVMGVVSGVCCVIPMTAPQRDRLDRRDGPRLHRDRRDRGAPTRRRRFAGPVPHAALAPARHGGTPRDRRRDRHQPVLPRAVRES